MPSVPVGVIVPVAVAIICIVGIMIAVIIIAAVCVLRKRQTSEFTNIHTTMLLLQLKYCLFCLRYKKEPPE